MKFFEYGIQVSAQVSAPATVSDNFCEKQERAGYNYLFEALLLAVNTANNNY